MHKQCDPYERLACRYDRMHCENPRRREFFRTLFEDHSVQSVLDCSCGTGQDLIAFHQMGIHVEGSDLSRAMLTQADANLKRAHLHDIPLHCIDFRRLDQHFHHRFDAVVCLSNSINELHDDQDVVRALRSMSAVLRPGGLLIIDQGQNDASMRNPPLYDVIIDSPELTRLMIMEYEATLMSVHIVDLFHSDGRPLIEENVVQLRIRLQLDWQRLFAAADFPDPRFCGDWAGTPYSPDSAKRLIAVALSR